MCKDNVVVTIFNIATEGKREPVHAFTMIMTKREDVVLRVVDWIVENDGNQLEKYSFEYEDLEVTDEVWEGV